MSQNPTSCTFTEMCCNKWYKGEWKQLIIIRVHILIFLNILFLPNLLVYVCLHHTSLLYIIRFFLHLQNHRNNAVRVWLKCGNLMLLMPSISISYITFIQVNKQWLLSIRYPLMSTAAALSTTIHSSTHTRTLKCASSVTWYLCVLPLSLESHCPRE